MSSSGRHSYGSIRIVGGGRVAIGNYCSLAAGVHAVVLEDHRVDWVSTFPFWERLHVAGAPGSSLPQDPIITIENDVWIGANVTLLEGSHVCNGAVVGSFSVVHGRIPPYSVAVGNPARVVKYRFSESQIADLLEIKWWDWPDDKVKRYASLLCSGKVDEFIHAAKEEVSSGV